MRLLLCILMTAFTGLIWLGSVIHEDRAAAEVSMWMMIIFAFYGVYLGIRYGGR